MNTENKICQNCKFWTAWPKQPDPSRVFGDCRRHAPQVFQTDPGNRKPFLTKFPSTHEEEFCGSFKPTEKVSAPLNEDEDVF